MAPAIVDAAAADVSAPVAPPAPEARKAPLFERIGGNAALEAAVPLFYDKIQADPFLSPFFEGVDMRFQMIKQKMFMKYAFGGSPNYSGKSIAASHKHLILEKGLNLAHFDAVAGHFVATLTELGVPQDLIQEAAGIVLTTRPIFDPAAYANETATQA